MKTILLSLFIYSFSIFANGQTDSVAYKKTVESFQDTFNQESYESIFALFSEGMKDYLPLPNTISFFEGLRAQAGKMNETEFEGYMNPGTGSYKATFDNGIFTLLISLNEESEIAGLLIKPYKAPAKDAENASNNIVSENSAITKKLTEIIFEKIKKFPDQTQLAIALINNEEVSYFGAMREGNNFVEVDNSTKVFEIGSISKVFTATLLAELVIEGKVKLEDSINDYLDFDLNEGLKINFLSLANHSSGLPRLPSNLNLFLADPKNPYAQYDEEKLESYLKETLHISETENPIYEYSNLGAGLLAYVLAKIENSNYEDMLQSRIFTSYEMLNSTTEKNKIKQELVMGLDPEGKETSNWDLLSLKGAGAILSTVEDLTKFAMAQFSTDNIALKITQESTLKVNENMDTGLGWHLLKEKGYLFHNGGTGGYTSSMLLDVKNKSGIVILSNVSAFHPDMAQIDQLSFELIESLK